MTVESLKRELAETSRALHARGWVANHDGNVSARLGGGRFLCTPTAVSKGAVLPEMLLVVSDQGQVMEGERKVFSEFKLHLAAYRARPDINAVLHAHPPTATGFTVAQVPLGEPFMAEPVVSLGPEIPLVPFFPPGDPAEERAVADALGRANVIFMANHGVITVGPDLEHCLLRMELAEHLSRIALVSRQLGGPVAIPREQVGRLTEKHIKAGLAPSRAAGSPAVASQPAAGGADAVSIVTEALKRFS